MNQKMIPLEHKLNLIDILSRRAAFDLSLHCDSKNVDERDVNVLPIRHTIQTMIYALNLLSRRLSTYFVSQFCNN